MRRAGRSRVKNLNGVLKACAIVEHSFEAEADVLRPVRGNERTAQRRKEQGTLNVDESDRIARIARVTQRAVEAFGDKGQAREWIKRPNRTFQGFAPLGLLSTDAGTALVTDELGRIEYGDLY